ncbi:MAG: hypothetical protein K0S40_3716 [Actinomycetospora sp.]|nr:hypothetical protein [Actinomycetospora sp.]
MVSDRRPASGPQSRPVSGSRTVASIPESGTPLVPARASGGSSTEPTQQNPAASVPPRHEICTAVGSRSCIAAIRAAGPPLITVRRAGTAAGSNSGWSSTGSHSPIAGPVHYLIDAPASTGSAAPVM